MGIVFNELLKVHLIQYLIILCVVIVIYIIILRKQLFSIFDPMMFAILQAAGAFTTNIVLRLYGYMDSGLFISFILSEFAFIIGFLIVKRDKEFICEKINDEVEFSNKRNILFFISSFIYIGLQLLFYYKNGIPLFRNTTDISLLELEALAGPIKKILYALTPIISICCIDFFIREKRKNIFIKLGYYFMFTFLIISLIFSGWKSNMIIIVFMFSLYIVFIYGENKKSNLDNIRIKKANKKVIRLLIFSLVSAVGIIAFSYANKTDESPFYYLIKRISLSGDIFVYTYTQPSLLEVIDKGDYFITTFAGTFIGKISYIYDNNSIVKSLGLQAYQLSTGKNIIAGPNPRHNFIGLLYFGVLGGIIYSFLVGILTSIIRKTVYRKMKRGLYQTIIFCEIMYYVIYAHIDMTSLFINYIYYFFIVSIPIFFINEIIYKIVCKK